MRYTLVFCLAFFLTLPQTAQSQVAKFRLEATDLAGAPIDTVTVGDDFLLKTYTQQVGGFDGDPSTGGVFAGYLDIAFDDALASVNSLEHGPEYSNGTSGDFSMAGLMDNIGGFASTEDILILPQPPGPDEQYLFSVSMKALAEGELTFVGSESLSYPVHEVLVWTSLEPVAARDIDFGEENLRVDFGRLSLNVQGVPEPNSYAMLLIGVIAIPILRRMGNRQTSC